MSNPNPPVSLTPLDSTTIVGNALVFTFTIPSDSENSKLVFRLELDSITPIDLIHTNYMQYESRLVSNNLQGQWLVNVNESWEQLPSGGVGPIYYGLTGKVTILKQNVFKYPSINTSWYWQMSASNNISQMPVYNKVVYAQAVFG